MSEPTIKTALVVNSGMPGVSRVFREFEKQKARLAKVYTLEDLAIGRTAIPETVDSVIVGAWDENYTNISFPKGSFKRKIGVLWTSPIAQTEMEYTGYELSSLLGIKVAIDSRVLDFIWFGSPDWLHLFPKDPKKYFYSPYPISLKKPPLGQPTLAIGFTHVSMFGPTHMRKNFYNQVAAVKAAGAILHTNRMDETQKHFCEAVGVNFKAHSWMPEKEYFSTIQAMDMGLQVSHCGVESNSYVFFDHLMMNVPCLTSLDDAPAQLRCLPNDIHRMVQKIREGFQYENWREWVKTYAENRNRLFNQTMSEKGM